MRRRDGASLFEVLQEPRGRERQSKEAPTKEAHSKGDPVENEARADAASAERRSVAASVAADPLAGGRFAESPDLDAVPGGAPSTGRLAKVRGWIAGAFRDVPIESGPAAAGTTAARRSIESNATQLLYPDSATPASRSEGTTPSAAGVDRVEAQPSTEPEVLAAAPTAIAEPAADSLAAGSLAAGSDSRRLEIGARSGIPASQGRTTWTRWANRTLELRRATLIVGLAGVVAIAWSAYEVGSSRAARELEVQERAELGEWTEATAGLPWGPDVGTRVPKQPQRAVVTDGDPVLSNGGDSRSPNPAPSGTLPTPQEKGRYWVQIAQGVEVRDVENLKHHVEDELHIDLRILHRGGKMLLVVGFFDQRADVDRYLDLVKALPDYRGTKFRDAFVNQEHN